MAITSYAVSAILGTIYVVGWISAFHAIHRTRTSQGAIAWGMALVTLPFVAVPLYWVLGRTKYHGYIKARKRGQHSIQQLAERIEPGIPKVRFELPEERASLAALENLVNVPFVRGNHSRLLIDGEQTFEAIFEAMDRAENYILTQFYIVRDDGLGRRFKSKLIERAKDGVDCYFLYDEFGSHRLSSDYIEELQAARVRVSPFSSTRGRHNRFQVNFRNHRKVVVIDGKQAFVGGSNVGDEYLGLSPKLSPWRDTHVQITGPASLAVQLSYLEDWYWATHEAPDWIWEPQVIEDGEESILVLPTGPADRFETCSYFFSEMARLAKERLWIASPYLVLDSTVASSLQLAALRGVDVRILIPSAHDQLISWFASFAYLQPLLDAGVQLFRYRPGFMHQKVLLVDEDLAAVGTANLDNRSFRLNFELIPLHLSRRFASEVESMLEEDFQNSDPIEDGDLASRSFLFNLGVSTARLWAPIL